MNIETSITAAVQRAVDSVIDSIAAEGVDVLTNVLRDEGFTEFEYLKNYQVFAHVKARQIWFEIVLDINGLDDESLVKVATEEPEEDELPPEGAKTYARNEFGNVGRVINHVNPMKDARKHARDARKHAMTPPHHKHDVRISSNERAIRHSVAAHAPRSLLINRQGQISLVMKSMIAKKKSDEIEFTYRHKQFEGAIGRFLDKFSDVVSKQFSVELQKIVMRYTS